MHQIKNFTICFIIAIAFYFFLKWIYNVWVSENKKQNEILSQKKINKIFWDNLKDQDFNNN